MFDVYVVTQISRAYDGEHIIDDNTIVVSIHKTYTGAFDKMHESVKEYINDSWRYLFVDDKYVYGVWRFDAVSCIRQEISFNVEMMTLEA